MRRIKPPKRLEFKEAGLAASKLERVGLLATKSRIAILSIFFRIGLEKLHVTRIYQILQNNDYPIAQSTIYNAVDLFVSAGVLAIGRVTDGVSYYELNEEKCISQIVCRMCGVRQNISDLPLIECCRREVKKMDFDTDKFTLTIIGVCKKCRT